MNATDISQASVAPAAIELSLVNSSTQANPDKVILVFTDSLLSQIAKIQAGLLAMDLGYTEVTVPLPDDLQMLEEGDPWIQEERDSSEGDFEPSSVWLHVQKDCLAIEIWDEHADDELHGSVNINDIPGLADELARRAPAATQALLARLS